MQVSRFLVFLALICGYYQASSYSDSQDKAATANYLESISKDTNVAIAHYSPESPTKKGTNSSLRITGSQFEEENKETSCKRYIPKFYLISFLLHKETQRCLYENSDVDTLASMHENAFTSENKHTLLQIFRI